jgi:hypothetical protein
MDPFPANADLYNQQLRRFAGEQDGAPLSFGLSSKYYDIQVMHARHPVPASTKQ